MNRLIKIWLLLSLLLLGHVSLANPLSYNVFQKTLEVGATRYDSQVSSEVKRAKEIYQTPAQLKRLLPLIESEITRSDLSFLFDRKTAAELKADFLRDEELGQGSSMQLKVSLWHHVSDALYKKIDVPLAASYLSACLPRASCEKQYYLERVLTGLEPHMPANCDQECHDQYLISRAFYLASAGKEYFSELGDEIIKSQNYDVLSLLWNPQAKVPSVLTWKTLSPALREVLEAVHAPEFLERDQTVYRSHERALHLAVAIGFLKASEGNLSAEAMQHINREIGALDSDFMVNLQIQLAIATKDYDRATAASTKSGIRIWPETRKLLQRVPSRDNASLQGTQPRAVTELARKSQEAGVFAKVILGESELTFDEKYKMLNGLFQRYFSNPEVAKALVYLIDLRDLSYENFSAFTASGDARLIGLKRQFHAYHSQSLCAPTGRQTASEGQSSPEPLYSGLLGPRTGDPVFFGSYRGPKALMSYEANPLRLLSSRTIAEVGQIWAGKTRLGVGFQVDACHVLTAAHVTSKTNSLDYRIDDGEQVRWVRGTLLSSGGGDGIFGSVADGSTNGDELFHEIRKDWAIIRLSSPQSLNSYFEFSPDPEAAIHSPIHTTGLFREYGHVEQRNCQVLFQSKAGYLADTCFGDHGMSGSPLFYQQGDKKYVIGIRSLASKDQDHRDSLYSSNSAVFLSEKLDAMGGSSLKEIKKALASDPCP